MGVEGGGAHENTGLHKTSETSVKTFFMLKAVVKCQKV